MTSLP